MAKLEASGGPRSWLAALPAYRITDELAELKKEVSDELANEA